MLALRTSLVTYRVMVSGDHETYVFPIDEFRSLGMRSWKFNRPVDESRISEIREAMDVNAHVDGPLYVAFVRGDGFVHYEGGHRAVALHTTTNVNHVMVDMLWDVDDTRITEEFKRLNKAISVPTLYVSSERDTDVRVQLEAIVNLYRKQYPTHVSNTGRPQRPNFNRDKLFEDLYRIHKERSLPVDALVDMLDKKNAECANRDSSKLSPKIVEKCKASGLWLFAHDTSL